MNNAVKRSYMLFFIITGLILLNCAAVQEMVKASKPDVTLQNIRFVNLTFDEVDFAFDLNITNPNAFAVNMAGFDYDFQIDGASFIKGQKQDELVINPSGESTVQIPLSLSFADLYKTYTSLKNQDSSRYTFKSTLYFNLPVIGRTPIPVSKSGQIPLVQLPKLKISSLKLKKVNFTGANLELNLAIDNPNGFSLFLKNLNYDFAVNGMKWASGVNQNLMTVNENGESTLTIPMSLDFLKMGRTVYNLIKGDSDLNYELTSNIDLNTSAPLLKNVNLPFNKTGQIQLTR